MSLIFFNPEEVRLKKFAATTTSGSKKTNSVIRIELVTSDPYALASLLNQLDEVEAEQRTADAAAREVAKPHSPSRSTRKLASTPQPFLLPYHGSDK